MQRSVLKKVFFFADGIKLIYEVVKSGYEILTCFVQEGADLSVLPNSVDKDRVIIAGENVMQKISPAHKFTAVHRRMQNQGANAAGHTGQLYTGVRADTRSVKCRRDSEVCRGIRHKEHSYGTRML